tara:strand:- start:940 stop:1275 length:336 start_codon:yes stop_codon:yes gene_type:complete
MNADPKPPNVRWRFIEVDLKDGTKLYLNKSVTHLHFFFSGSVDEIIFDLESSCDNLDFYGYDVFHFKLKEHTIIGLKEPVPHYKISARDICKDYKKFGISLKVGCWFKKQE